MYLRFGIVSSKDLTFELLPAINFFLERINVEILTKINRNKKERKQKK